MIGEKAKFYKAMMKCPPKNIFKSLKSLNTKRPILE